MTSNIVYIEENIVSCDGNGAEPGHPRIYLNLGDAGETVCPYCSRKFVLNTQ